MGYKTLDKFSRGNIFCPHIKRSANNSRWPSALHSSFLPYPSHFFVTLFSSFFFFFNNYFSLLLCQFSGSRLLSGKINSVLLKKKKTTGNYKVCLHDRLFTGYPFFFKRAPKPFPCINNFVALTALLSPHVTPMHLLPLAARPWNFSSCWSCAASVTVPSLIPTYS